MKFSIDLLREWIPFMENWEINELLNNFQPCKKESLTKDVIVCFIEYVYDGYKVGNKPIGKRLILAKILTEEKHRRGLENRKRKRKNERMF